MKLKRSTWTVLLIILAVGVVLNILLTEKEWTEQDIIKWSTKNEKPAIIDFWADWCPYCGDFHEALDDREFAAGIDEYAKLFKINGEKNLPLMQKLKASGFPNFPVVIARNGKLEPIGHMSGFGDKKRFLDKLKVHASSKVTIKEREERYAKNPTLEDAEFLADVYQSRHNDDKAIFYQQEMIRLGHKDAPKLRFWVFLDQAWAIYTFYSPTKYAEVVDRVENHWLKVGDKRQKSAVISMLSYLSVKYDRKEDIEHYVPLYLADQKTKAKEATDPKKKKRWEKSVKYAQVTYIVHIEKAPQRAWEFYQKEILQSGWEDDWRKLNSVAFGFIYRNWKVMPQHLLDYGREVSIKSVELVRKKGNPRTIAMVLDSLARLEYILGNVERAIELMEEAVELQPHDKRHAWTLENFKSGKEI